MRIRKRWLFSIALMIWQTKMQTLYGKGTVASCYSEERTSTWYALKTFVDA